MTAISAPRAYADTTTFERSLLRAATALDHFVTLRLERRAGTDYRAAATAQASVAAARGAAEAHASMGLLPR